jgi:hypothetical protein
MGFHPRPLTWGRGAFTHTFTWVPPEVWEQYTASHGDATGLTRDEGGTPLISTSSHDFLPQTPKCGAIAVRKITLSSVSVEATISLLEEQQYLAFPAKFGL